MQRIMIFLACLAGIGEPLKGAEEVDLRSCILEYPREIQLRLERRDRQLMGAPPGISYLWIAARTWTPGSTITVAFRGGSDELRTFIADAAKEWTKHANIAFDFGNREVGHNFREWSTEDVKHSADIRIGFDQPGYWSLVGRDCNEISPVGLPSMNLGGFDKKLPSHWRATVIHEFGHALGLLHEHQREIANCEADFLFDDEDGYIPTQHDSNSFFPDKNGRRPGIYTILGGPPNNWRRVEVDSNFRTLPTSSAFRQSSSYDPLSIMKYHFPASMFKREAASDCASSRPNEKLSEEDIKGIARLYPKDASQLDDVLKMCARAEEVIGGLVERGFVAADKSPMSDQRDTESPSWKLCQNFSTELKLVLITATRGVHDPQLDLKRVEDLLRDGAARVNTEYEGMRPKIFVGPEKNAIGVYSKDQLSKLIDGLEIEDDTSLICYVKLHGRIDALGKDVFDLDWREGADPETVPREELIRILKSRRAKLTVLIVESCRKLDVDLQKKDFAEVAFPTAVFSDLFVASEGFVHVSSASPGQAAWMDGNEALFTRAFLETFKPKADALAGLLATIDSNEDSRYDWDEFVTYLETPTNDLFLRMQRSVILSPPDSEYVPPHVRQMLLWQTSQKPQLTKISEKGE